MLTATVEQIEKGFAVRIHVDGDTDTYPWSCVVIPDGDIAELKLVQRAPRPSEARVLRSVLEGMGFNRARRERRKGGGRVMRVYPK